MYNRKIINIYNYYSTHSIHSHEMVRGHLIVSLCNPFRDYRCFGINSIFAQYWGIWHEKGSRQVLYGERVCTIWLPLDMVHLF